jgi:hypothetical protein
LFLRTTMYWSAIGLRPQTFNGALSVCVLGDAIGATASLQAASVEIIPIASTIQLERVLRMRPSRLDDCIRLLL